MEVGVFANVNEFVFVHDPTAYEPRHRRWHDDTDFGALCRIPTVTLTRVLLASPLANMLRVEWHYGDDPPRALLAVASVCSILRVFFFKARYTNNMG